MDLGVPIFRAIFVHKRKMYINFFYFLFNMPPRKRNHGSSVVDSPISKKSSIEVGDDGDGVTDAEILEFEAMHGHRSKDVEDVLAEDDFAGKMYAEGQKQTKLFLAKKAKAEKDKMKIAEAMKKLEKKGEDIAEGKYDSARCPMCKNMLIINTSEKKEMSVFCSKKCNLPFIFHVNEKIPTLARYAKRMDPHTNAREILSV